MSINVIISLVANPQNLDFSREALRLLQRKRRVLPPQHPIKHVSASNLICCSSPSYLNFLENSVFLLWVSVELKFIDNVAKRIKNCT